MTEDFELGKEEMRAAVVEFLEKRSQTFYEAYIRGDITKFRESLALDEAASIIRLGKELEGGFSL